ncbi:MAG: hypothetical protein AAF357_01320 [Verrucomicrobiota bacterium]
MGIRTLVFIAALIQAGDGQASPELSATPTLEELRNAIVQFESIKVSEVHFPGCTGPFVRVFEYSIDSDQYSITSMSDSGERSGKVVTQELSVEEIDQISKTTISHFETAAEHQSPNQRMFAAIKARDIAAIEKLKSEHPMPMGGYATTMIQILIRKEGQTFSFSEQFRDCELSKRFTEWMTVMHEKASSSNSAEE